MIRHQEIIFALAGQSFYFDVPEGRPDASPTVKVYLATNSDVAPTEAATTGSVTLEAIDTTLTANAAAGTNTLALTSATGVARNRRFLLTAADGTTEWIEVLGISGLNVTTRRPLTNAFSTGDKFQSTRISIGVDLTWASAPNHVSDIFGVTWRTDREPRTEWLAGYAGYRVRWSYAISGVVTLGVSYADLVRYSAKNLANPLDVDGRFPGWIDRLPTDYQKDQGASLLLEAFYAFKMDLIGDNEALRRIRNTEIVTELVVHKANTMIAENAVLAGHGSPDAFKLAEERYQQRYRQLLREPKVQVDQTSGGEAARAQRLPAWRR